MWEWAKDRAVLITAVSALATILLTIFNIVMGLWTAGTARKNLKLAREQFSRQWHPKLHAEVFSHAAYTHAFRITNLGKVAVVLNSILLRRALITSAAIEGFSLEHVVEAESSNIIPVTREIREYMRLRGPWTAGRDLMEVAFSYSAAGQDFKSEWFRFYAVMEGNTLSKLEPAEAHVRVRRG